MTRPQVVVIGAGPAGISAALALKDADVRPLVLDRDARVASSWRGRYDRLRLNTCRPFSHLPDRPYPKGTPMFPSRDQVVAYLEHHSREDGIDLRLDTRVDRIDADRGEWVLDTSAGALRAAQVIVATGYENAPFIPDWPGRERFAGLLMHSCEYRNAEPFSNRKVLVVGPGSSGMEIAHDLAEGGAARVWLSARTPPNILLREGPGGVPGDMIAVTLLRVPVRFADAFTRLARKLDLGDLTAYGLPLPEEGVFARMHRLGVAPAIVDREVIEAIQARRIEVVRAVVSLDSSGVTLADGARAEPDVVICATGYRRALEPLVGHLGVLDDRGLPRACGAEPAAPGLRFIGYVPRPGALGYMAREAKRAAKAIGRELGDSGDRAPCAKQAAYEYRRAGTLRRFVRRTAGTQMMIALYQRIQVPLDRLVHGLTRGRTTLSSLLSGLPVVMVTTTGARTGVMRTQPVLGIPDGEAVVLIASNYGGRSTPAWCHNLRADPRALVTMGSTTLPFVARELEDAERERWFRRGVELYPPFEQYRRRASPRRIPILRLEPADSSSALKGTALTVREPAQRPRRFE
jgi:deazaflavin-dependent oxidoreductase (nitroreductase family)